MFEKLAIILGTSLSAMGVAFQGISLGNPKSDMAVKIVAISCSGLGAGFLAVSPSMRRSSTRKAKTLESSGQ